ncbi:hypothetical protein RJ55_02707 [Drechmeria coniospora]|nr:hypothetical protein RJ55_02707 [Drechmeria coniospora]
MQHYPVDDPYEREPLGSYGGQPDGSGRHAAVPYDGYPQSASPYYDDASSRNQAPYHPGGSRGPQDYPRPSNTPARGLPNNGQAPLPPPHGDHGYYGNGRGRPPQDGPSSYGQPAAAGGMAAIAYSVADRSDLEVMHPGHIPPPPSRTQQLAPRGQYMPYNGGGGGGGYPYDPNQPRGPDQDSHSSLNPFGTPLGTGSGTHSPARSVRSLGFNDSYADDPYQQSARPQHNHTLGVVNPNEIDDDGDDGIQYATRPQRAASPSSNSNRGVPASIGPAAAVGGAAAAGGAAGLMSSRGGSGGRVYDAGAQRDGEKPSAWMAEEKGRSKKWKWIIIIVVILAVVGGIVGGVLGAVVGGNKKDAAGGGNSGESAADDTKKNGDLDINSSEIKELMNNPALHKVFPGMDYTPLNTQYPDCLENPPSQNNVTRDVAILSQLTNKIRLYGTDCNQTQMLIHAVNQLKLTDQVKIWLGVWQDGNATTNSRQLAQMWDILDEYGEKPFEGVIVANEILFREEMTITTLGQVLDKVRTNLTAKKINLPVATSDLGDDWTKELGDDSDYIMANIHPFFAGVAADKAASWTWSFWKNKDGPFWKSDKQKNVISETGWPSGGGKSCGSDQTTSCSPGSVAGIDEMNQFMADWVCAALDNGTNYFWFEAFDEPWKVRFNTKGKEWEDKWGLMDTSRRLKDGIKIPDCGGKTVS